MRTMTEKSILIVDDEPNIRRVLKAVFSKVGYSVLIADSGRKALEIISAERHLNVILCDLVMPDVNGIEVLKAVKEMDPNISVVMITAYGTINTAVEAMKLGALDYITKPFDMDEIKIIVRNAMEKNLLLQENEKLRRELDSYSQTGDMIGISGGMKDVFRMIERVADTNATVLLRGESGTGKELAARALHNNSRRREKPFVAVSCAALPETLLESELFGHEKGAFTGAISRKPGRFELADNGTLFLDEICEMSPGIQVKLLRVLQEREFERVGGTKPVKVDVRLITATNRDPEEEIKKGTFRADLYYRLQVLQITLPPLRERREDIPPLAEYFLEKFNKKNNRAVKRISREAMNLLKEHDWPGNVRELENTIERAVVLSDPDEKAISPDLLSLSIKMGG